METNNDIERILREDPIESTSKIQTYGKIKKPNVLKKFFSKPGLKKKVLIGIGVMLLVILNGFFLISNLGECDVCEDVGASDTNVQTVSIDNLKQQIIAKGYAEIKDGATILKLSPYTK